MNKKCMSHYRITGTEATLDISYFSRDKSSQDGYSNRCKICCCIIRNNSISPKEAQLITARKIEARKLADNGLRECTKCGKIKEIDSEFYHPQNTSKQARGALRSYCKTCCRKHRQQWSKTPSTTLKLRKYRRERRESDKVKKWAAITLVSHQKRYPNTDIVLTVDDIIGLIPDGVGNCGYCGNEVRIGYNVSLDVVDRASPISIDNVIVCCKPCNSTKSRSTAGELLSKLRDKPFLDDITMSNHNLLRAYYASIIPFDILVEMSSNYLSNNSGVL